MSRRRSTSLLRPLLARARHLASKPSLRPCRFFDIAVFTAPSLRLYVKYPVSMAQHRRTSCCRIQRGRREHRQLRGLNVSDEHQSKALLEPLQTLVRCCFRPDRACSECQATFQIISESVRDSSSFTVCLHSLSFSALRSLCSATRPSILRVSFTESKKSLRYSSESLTFFDVSLNFNACTAIRKNPHRILRRIS